jgi:TonB family protein
MYGLRRVWLLFATITLTTASVTLVPVNTLAQDAPTSEVKDHGGRKVKSSVKPFYPDVARQMHISGTVRLEATVAPDGKVRDTRVIGGSPLLAQEVAFAVKKWKYEEAPKETVEVVEVVYK